MPSRKRPTRLLLPLFQTVLSNTSIFTRYFWSRTDRRYIRCSLVFLQIPTTLSSEGSPLGIFVSDHFSFFSSVHDIIFNFFGYILSFMNWFSIYLSSIYLLCISSYYLPLLSHKKSYISRFAAESFSFLIRKLELEELTSFVSFILHHSTESRTETLSTGVTFLLFEATKVNGHRIDIKSIKSLDWENKNR